MASEIATTLVQLGWIPEGPVAYELFGTGCAVHFNSSGTPSHATAYVTPFRLNGTSRTQIATVNTSASEFAVLLCVTSASGATTVSKATSVQTNTLSGASAARFDLVPTAKVSGTSYSNSDVVARCNLSITRDGTNGTNGSFTSTVFIRSASKPTAPTGGTYTSPIPTSKWENKSWTDAPLSGPDPVWISRAVFNSSHTGTNSPTWSDPVPAVDSNDIEFVWSAKESPNGDPPGPPFSDNGGDWSKNATGAVWMATAIKSNGVWGNWQKVRVKGEKGDKGDAGDNAIMLTLSPSVVQFKKSGSTTAKVVYLDITDGSNRVKPDSMDSLNSTGVGSSGTLTDGLTWQWQANAGGSGRMGVMLIYNGTADINLTKEITVTYKGKRYSQTLQVQTVADGENGISGKNGVWVPPPMLFEDYPDKYVFMSGNLAKTPPETRMDIVVIKTNTGKLVPYRCILGYTKTTASPTPDKDPTHWQAADAGVYKFLATDLLWANIGQVNFLSGQAFRIGDNSGMCGYFGTPTGETNGGAIFYSGGDSVANATYVVYKNGKVVATNADISGRICTSIMDYKVSTSGEGVVPNGSLCFNASLLKLPELAPGNVRSIRVFNPCNTRLAAEDLVLIPENSRVRISGTLDFDLAQSKNVTVSGCGQNGRCLLELLGVNVNNITTWIVSILSRQS